MKKKYVIHSKKAGYLRKIDDPVSRNWTNKGNIFGGTYQEAYTFNSFEEAKGHVRKLQKIHPKGSYTVYTKTIK